MSSVRSAVSDSFLAAVCDKGVELRRLSIYPGGPVSAELLCAIVRVCPSLSELSLTRSDRVDDDLVDLVVDAVRQYHGGKFHRRDVSLTSENSHQIQLTFTPLKLLTALASCPYLT